MSGFLMSSHGKAFFVCKGSFRSNLFSNLEKDKVYLEYLEMLLTRLRKGDGVLSGGMRPPDYALF